MNKADVGEGWTGEKMVDYTALGGRHSGRDLFMVKRESPNGDWHDWSK